MRSDLATAPRRVFCVYEHRYRSRAIADAIVSGRFSIQGLTLDLGIEPDWIGAALPPDREWRLEWTKFYYGLDLATAAEDTGDLEYARAWLRLVRSWIDQVPIDRDPSDVLGRRIQNWIYAWSRFALVVDLEALSPGCSRAIAASLGTQIAHLERHLTRERNHRTLELYALFIAALALPWLDEDGTRLAAAFDLLHQNLLADILPDGVQRERSTHYHHVVLRSLVGARENAARFGLAVPREFDERLERACEFALHCHRPDGSIPALSDSDSGSYLDLLAHAGRLLARPDFSYVATRGGTGVAPAACSASFAHGGYYIQRSGWGDGAHAIADARYLIFDCGAIGDGGHGHYDALSVDMAAHGTALVVDPGRYTYCDDAPHWRRWFKGTAAHNTVTVDGLNQTPYQRNKPRGPVAEARLLHRATRPGFDLLWGEVVSPAYDAVHRRRVMFVGDEYWLIEDRLDAPTPHRFDLRFHLPPGGDPSLARTSGRDSWTASTATLRLVVAADASAAIEPGWVSTEYGIKLEAPVLAFTQSGVARATFVTLIAHARTIEQPCVRVRTKDGIVSVDVVHGDAGARCDRIAWSIDGRPRGRSTAGANEIAVWTRSDAGVVTRHLALSESDCVFTCPEPAEAMS